MKALEVDGFKKIIAVLPRRSGKDITAWNLLIRAAIKVVGVYFYVFPTFASGRRILWDNITNDGFRVLDYLPPELVESRSEQQMRIRLTNGSLIQVIGSNDFDNSLVGTNPRGIVFSEYALTDPRAYAFCIPILRGNEGWVLFISTPRGKNHMWELWQIAENNPKDWFTYILTVNDTQHMSLHEIQKEISSGIISFDLAQQEYFCSFLLGQEGSYYSKYIDKMRLEGRIGFCPYEEGYPVHTAADIGVNDPTSIVFFQVVGQIIRVIDCWEKSDQSIADVVKLIRSK